MDRATLLTVFAVVGAVLAAEAFYLLFAEAKSNRDRINRRMKLSAAEENRAEVLVSIRKERGIGAGGESAIGLAWLGDLVTQSGVSLGVTKLAMIAAASGVLGGVAAELWTGEWAKGLLGLLVGGLVLPIGTLRWMRGRRLARFAIQLPEAIELIVRSLKAGHPVPVAIGLVGREMADPIGTEFGIVSDEVTYGSDLVGALRRLQKRVGQDDLPLFVTAVSIQSTSGGNLREILQGLSDVIRQRIKMRRKIKAISAEGRISAVFLTSLPFLLMGAISAMSPDYYGSVWGLPATNMGLAAAGGWLFVGNLMMRKKVRFRFLPDGPTGFSVSAPGGDRSDRTHRPVILDLAARLGPLPLLAAAGALVALLLTIATLVTETRRERALKRRLKVEPSAGRPRKAEAAVPPEKPAGGRKAVRTAVDWAVARAEGITRDGKPEQLRQLRLQLVRAGLFDPRGPALFMLARVVLAAAGGLGGTAVVVVQQGMPTGLGWSWALFGAGFGYLAPGFIVSRRAQRLLEENRQGFPDFMDLMGVCANAGLSMEAALDRVARELADLYPTLGVHLQTLCLEVRAGRPIEDALNGLGHRLNIPEVRSFATLLQQSKELGSSLSDALRVFSEDMRHKRLSLAEEKAYALPAKLSVPVTACILPVVLFVAILPVIVRFKMGLN